LLFDVEFFSTFTFSGIVLMFDTSFLLCKHDLSVVGSMQHGGAYGFIPQFVLGGYVGLVPILHDLSVVGSMQHGGAYGFIPQFVLGGVESKLNENGFVICSD
jgi:hypothetical protein